MTSFSLFSKTVFLMPHRAFQLGLVWLVYKCVIVLTAFLVEIFAMFLKLIIKELIIACIAQ